MTRIRVAFLLLVLGLSCRNYTVEPASDRFGWGIFEQVDRNGQYETIPIALIYPTGHLVGLSPVNEQSYCQVRVQPSDVARLKDRMESLVQSPHHLLDCSYFAPADWSETTFFCQINPVVRCVMIQAQFRIPPEVIALRSSEPLIYDAYVERNRSDRERIPTSFLSFYDDVRKRSASECIRNGSEVRLEKELVRKFTAFRELENPVPCSLEE